MYILVLIRNIVNSSNGGEIKRIEQAALGNVCFLTSKNIKNDTLVITLPEGKNNQDKFVSTVEDIINRVCKLLKIDGFTKMNTCPVCKKEAQYQVFGDNYLPIHDECKEVIINNIKAKILQEKSSKKPYIFAVILILLFGIIGLLPSLLLSYFNYGYFTPLIVLCPLLSCLGLFLSKAPFKKWIRVIAICTPFIIILIFNIISIPYMANMNGKTIVDYIFKDKFIGLRKIVFSTLLSLAGIGITKFISKFRPDYQKELDKLM